MVEDHNYSEGEEQAFWYGESGDPAFIGGIKTQVRTQLWWLEVTHLFGNVGEVLVFKI